MVLFGVFLLHLTSHVTCPFKYNSVTLYVYFAFDLLLLVYEEFFGFVYVLRLYFFFFFFSSRRRHTRCLSDWSSDVCSSDLYAQAGSLNEALAAIDEGMAESRANNERWWDAELHRLRGGLLLARGGDDDEVEIGRASCRERV